MDKKAEQSIAQWDQAMAHVLRTLPDAVRAVYLAFRRRGFTNAQAIDLTATWMTNVQLSSGEG
jgi:Tfp pilus assembly protein PilN